MTKLEILLLGLGVVIISEVESACHCSDLTFQDHRGGTIGKCLSKYKEKSWCYVPSDSDCLDKKTSKRGRDTYWSADACEKAKGSVIFITGGGGREKSTEVLDMEDSRSPCSRVTGNLPSERTYHSISILDDRSLVLCGGESDEVATSCIRTWSPDGLWSHHSQLTHPRWDHSVAVTDKNINFIGGWHLEAERTAESLDGSDWRQRRHLPYSIGPGSCSVVINNTAVIVTGGYRARTKVAMWNPQTDQWTALADMDGGGRRYHACAVLMKQGRKYVLVAGGKDEYNKLRSSSLYNLEEDEWMRTGDLNKVRDAGDIVVIGDIPYFLGGQDENYKSLNSVERFDAQRNVWTKIDFQMKYGRLGFSAVAVDRETFCNDNPI